MISNEYKKFLLYNLKEKITYYYLILNYMLINNCYNKHYLRILQIDIKKEKKKNTFYKQIGIKEKNYDLLELVKS